MIRVDKNKLVKEAQDRFKRTYEFQSVADKRWMDDYKFGHGDSYNNWQWPDDVLNKRNKAKLPCLTVNKTRAHCLQIVSGIVQADPSIKYLPVGDEATKDSAEIFEGVARHIMYQSNFKDGIAPEVIKHQVFGGIGRFRVLTDYRDKDSQDQDIFLEWLRDPTRVFVDPDTKEPDGSDARFAFIYDEMPKDQFDYEYPDFNIRAKEDAYGTVWRGARSDKHVGVVEYYRRVTKRDKMFYLDTGDTALASELAPEIRAALREADTPERTVETHKIEWFKLCGNEILEKTLWAGDIIPIIDVVGEITVIDGELDRKGHVRTMIDGQRMYNYNRSAQTQAIALQNKVPYVGPMEAFSSLEQYYESANQIDYAWLPYNAYDSQDRPLPAPQRQPPPIVPEAYVQAAEMAAADMQMVSGQYEASMGADGQELSGKAVQQRQQAGENGSFHFLQNYQTGVRKLGKILLDLIPKIYTSERVMKIMAEDGTQSDVKLDPQAAHAARQLENEEEQQIKAIFNPNVGKYQVEADVGPGFMTRRQEAFQALVQIVTQAPEMMHIIGDILMRYAPFPGAEEIAERLHNMVPPQALGGPSPQTQAAAAEIQKQNGMITKLMQDLGAQKQKLDDATAKHEIEEYRAQTDRMKAIKDIDPEIMVPLVRELLVQAYGITLPQLQASHGLNPGTPAAQGLPPAPAAEPQPQAAAQPQGQPQ